MNSTAAFLDVLKEWVELLMRHSMHGFLIYAKEHGFSMSQLGALMHISRKGVSGIADIGDDLGVTSAAVSQMIDRLVQQSLIERSEDPDDRRAKHIELTLEGTQAIRGCTEARQQWLSALSESLSDKERRLAAETLDLLVQKTRKLETPPT